MCIRSILQMCCIAITQMLFYGCIFFISTYNARILGMRFLTSDDIKQNFSDESQEF